MASNHRNTKNTTVQPVESARTKFERLIENEKLYDAYFKQAETGLREVYNGLRKSIMSWRALELEEGERSRRALIDYDRQRAEMCDLRRELEKERALKNDALTRARRAENVKVQAETALAALEGQVEETERERESEVRHLTSRTQDLERELERAAQVISEQQGNIDALEKRVLRCDKVKKDWTKEKQGLRAKLEKAGINYLDNSNGTAAVCVETNNNSLDDATTLAATNNNNALDKATMLAANNNTNNSLNNSTTLAAADNTNNSIDDAIMLAANNNNNNMLDDTTMLAKVADNTNDSLDDNTTLAGANNNNALDDSTTFVAADNNNTLDDATTLAANNTTNNSLDDATMLAANNNNNLLDDTTMFAKVAEQSGDNDNDTFFSDEEGDRETVIEVPTTTKAKLELKALTSEELRELRRLIDDKLEGECENE